MISEQGQNEKLALAKLASFALALFVHFNLFFTGNVEPAARWFRPKP